MSNEIYQQNEQQADTPVGLKAMVEEFTTPSKPSQADLDIAFADESYERLRDAIGDAVTAAITSGKVLLIQKSTLVDQETQTVLATTPVAFEAWRQALPESTQQHYNCQHCNQVWNELFNIAVVDEVDGHVKLVYPALQALLSVKDDPILAKFFASAPEGFEVYLEEFGSIKGRTYFPLATLPLQLSSEPTGHWNHFYAASLEQLNAYNDQLQIFNDYKYVDNLFGQFLAKEMNVDQLGLLFTYLKKELQNESKEKYLTANTALLNSDKLLKIIEKTRQYQNEARIGTPYLWSLLMRRENSWLRHINGSVLGIVLDGARSLSDETITVAAAVSRMKSLLVTATDTENYKVKTAPVASATTEQVYKYLVENNLQATLQRRMMSFGEMQNKVWEEPSLEIPLEAPAETTSALDKVFKKVQENKDAEKQTTNYLESMVHAQSTSKCISLAAFIQELDTVQSLELTLNLNMGYIPLFVTTAVEEGDHDKLLRFEKNLGPYAHILSSQRPVRAHEVMSYASIDNIFKDKYSKLIVTNIFKSESADNSVFFVGIAHIAENFSQLVSGNGSCILGTMIKSEHYGLSGAIVELSKGFQLENNNPPGQCAGGLQMTTGQEYAVQYKDGTKAKVVISSYV